MKNKLFLATLFFSLQSIAQTKTYWQPAQTMKMKNITAVVPSPDGKKVAYAVREAIMTDDRSEYAAQIFLCNADGSNTVQLTKGDRNNTMPKWSPDGSLIGFISNRDSKSNLYILPVAGGESERLTDVKTAVSDFEWGPDGKTMAYTMSDAPDDVEEKRKKAKDDWYFMDETYKQGRLYVLWLNERDTVGKQKVLKVTKDNRHISTFDWSPDGKWIVYAHAASPGVNDNVYSDIAMVNVAGGEIKNIAATKAGESSPVFSPDGKQIAYITTDEPVVWAGKSYVNLAPVAGGKAMTLATTPNEPGGMLGWSADGKYIYTSEAKGTLFSIYRLSANGKEAAEWNSKPTHFISGITLNAKGTHFGFVQQNATTPGEAYVSNATSFAPVKLTGIHSAYANAPVPKTEVVKWKSVDGKEIEGLLTYPLGYQQGKRHPFLLNIHGGPAGVFSQTFIGSSGAYPLAAFAERGFFILRPNPRGSTGYGVDFRLANQQDWGGADYSDLMTGVDHVLKTGMIDSTRMGVMGWSYGGFMSSWVVGHTDRFKAASIGAPVVDLMAQNLTDDIGGFLPSYMKKQPWEDWEMYNTHSPLRFVHNVKTPVLLQHGEADIRVPFSQGVMWYNALKRRGVPVRFLVLPRQPHGPTEPRMLLKVLETNIEWMEKYLLPDAKKGDAKTAVSKKSEP